MVLAIFLDWKWTKSSQNIVLAQKVSILVSVPPATHFEWKFMGTLAIFRQYRTESSESLRSCKVSYSYKQNVTETNSSEQNFCQILFNFVCFGDEQFWFHQSPQISNFLLKIQFQSFQIWNWIQDHKYSLSQLLNLQQAKYLLKVLAYFKS